MNVSSQTYSEAASLAAPEMVLRRHCACRQHAPVGQECAECRQNRSRSLGLDMGLGRGPEVAEMAPPIVHEVLNSPGQPLDVTTRSRMERRFRHDFSKVRVHRDDSAARSALQVNAAAYTVGSEIVFGPNRFAPTTHAGAQLLAHELAHVVQQGMSGNAPVSRSGLQIGTAEDSAEHEADVAASVVMKGSPAVSSHAMHAQSAHERPQLRRQPDDDKPKKEAPPLIPIPIFDRFDIKPVIPGPISAPSLEDVNQAYYKVFGPKGDPKANMKCAIGWRMLKTGMCCPGTSVDVGCCPPYRLTSIGRCCPADSSAHGTECEKFPALPAAKMPGASGDKGVTPGSQVTKGLEKQLSAPLTMDFPIYFKHNQPGAVTSGKALGGSLTEAGQSSLESLVAWMMKGLEFSVQLTGKASVEGPKTHNQELGRFRALSVAGALMQRGILGIRIADPPGSPPECPAISTGIHNCGDRGAGADVNPSDRQVLARVFATPQNP